MTLNADAVWSFILGIGLGILIGCIITFIYDKSTNKKFCPTCGATYIDAAYCEYDGTLLKERGN